MNETPMNEGEVIKLAGKDYILPPIPLIKMAKIGQLMKGGDFTQDEAYVDALIDALWWSLQRNYGKTFPRETVELNLDASNINKTMEAFMKVNGFASAAAPSGEAQAGQ